MAFNDALHTLTLSDDGSYTAYSKEYEQHYHSTKDGALHESLSKHVIPAFELIDKEEIYILDICYGLGFNTLATLLYYQQNAAHVKLHIYSPELDAKLVKSLELFSYPKEFAPLEEIIVALSRKGVYCDEKIAIEIHLGDAREYVKKFHNFFDIVYQDAFSPDVNPLLWTKEYFGDIARAMKHDAVLTTYSIAFKIRLALYENGFHVYLNEGEGYRTATLASLTKLPNATEVDMEHKIACNAGVKSLRDADV